MRRQFSSELWQRFEINFADFQFRALALQADEAGRTLQPVSLFMEVPLTTISTVLLWQTVVKVIHSPTGFSADGWSILMPFLFRLAGSLPATPPHSQKSP